jgi:hypothetical protein
MQQATETFEQADPQRPLRCARRNCSKPADFKVVLGESDLAARTL